MSTATLTSVGVIAYLEDKGIDLRIHEDDGSFKAIPNPRHMAVWREFVTLYNEPTVSAEKITLHASDVLAAEAELRTLLLSKDVVKLSDATLFRYTKDRTRFTFHTDQKQPAMLGITSQPERLKPGSPQAEAYLIALKSSFKCRSAEMLSNGIEVFLAPKWCSNKERLATYLELVELY